MTVEPQLAYTTKKNGESAIRIYVYHGGRKTYVATGHSVHPELWNSKNGQVKPKHPNHQAYNLAIHKQVSELKDRLLAGGGIGALSASSDTKLLEYLQSYIKSATDVRKSTLRSYQTAYNSLKEYARHLGKSDIEFAEVTKAFAQSFLNWKERSGASSTSQITTLQKLKKVMRLSHTKGLHASEAWEAISVPKERKTNKIYLTMEEIAHIHELDLSHNPSLERQRDLFCIAYALFMRYCDVVLINPSMRPQNGDEEPLLTYTSVKTGIRANVPLTEETLVLLDKYDWQLDFATNQQVNRDLKRIASMAGITTRVQQEGQEAPKSEFVTFHTARRSAATNANLAGMDLQKIAGMGGWKKLSTLSVYLKASNEVSARHAASHPFFRNIFKSS